jgi:hypothetical protein
MLNTILILLIIIVVYKIFITYNSEKFKNSYKEPYINITNPFVQGLSQAQLGSDMVDQVSYMDQSDLPSTNKNVLISKNIKNNDIINRINKLSKNNRINDNINLVSTLKNKEKLTKNIKINNNDNNKNENKSNSKIPCKKLNKFFIASQFNDSYRDVLTAFFNICPDQKSFFNSQSLPVITTMYKMDINTPFEFIKLTTQFVNKLNKEISTLPDSVEIINTYNNYLPLTSQVAKYVEDKGINKFYKEIGVDYNLYADTPPNSPVELIKLIKLTREYTEAETKYIITMVLKKILKSVNDQIQITVHFITKNDPLEGYNLFNGAPDTQTINTTKNIAIEFIFVDGFYTNDFDVDYDCMDTQTSKKVSNIDGDDNYYSFDALGTNNLLSDNEIIREFNKKLRQHDIEMNNFNVNVPYPVYNNKPN